MSSDRDIASLQHMIDHAIEVRDMIKDINKSIFSNDRKLQLALTRLIEVIGESATRISQETKNKYSNIPWKQIIGMRNRLIHGYDVLDYDILWNTACDEIPVLLKEIETILHNYKTQ